MSRPVLVLPSPPTANGDLHLGHLAGPYLAADAFARYRRMRGHDVAYVTGADVHQSYVVQAAERLLTTPEAAADRFAQRIEDTLRAADIEVDAFVRPHRSERYQTFVGTFFRHLSDEGLLVPSERPVLWCRSCSQYLFGAAVRGRCGSCGGDSDGALCEHCSHPVTPGELRDPRCSRCGGEPTSRPMRRLFFTPARLVAKLRAYHSEVRMRPHPRTVVEELLDDGPFEAAITAPGTWGIPVPMAGFDDQRLDVWAEVGPGYIASTQELTAGKGDPEGWRRYWCASDAEIVQFFGFDNTAPHTLFYPALYLASGGIRPPDHFVINEFHRLDGEKFSTSRRHAVWAGQALLSLPVDALRYYLCLSAPEEAQGDFTLADFRKTANLDLRRTVGPLVQDLVRALGSGTHLPPADGSALMRELHDRASELGRFLEPATFSLRGAARCWSDMTIWLGRSLLNGGGESGNGQGGSAQMIADSLCIVAGCAQPLMPRFARRLWTALGAEDDLRTQPWGEPARRITGRVAPLDAGAVFPEVTEAQLRLLASGSVRA